MGHAGRHTYKDCINNLYEKIDPSAFANRLLHLKSRDGEEDIAEEIKSLCSSLNIRVIETKENIVYHAENHQVHSAGYFKDIYKSYSDLEIRKQKDSFLVEDDGVAHQDASCEDDNCQKRSESTEMGNNLWLEI